MSKQFITVIVMLVGGMVWGFTSYDLPTVAGIAFLVALAGFMYLLWLMVWDIVRPRNRYHKRRSSRRIT